MISEKELVRSLQVFLEQESKVDNFSGVVLLAKNKRVLFRYSSGFANKEKMIPNVINTKFNLGSLNKMFTAVAISQLVEKNLVKFDDLVGKYLPDYPNRDVKKEVSIHHLLTHTSGLGHYGKSWDKHKIYRKSLKSINNYVDLFKNEPLLFRPGEKYQYSGNGYELLGLIIESITQESYYDYVARNIFEKANMLNTGYFEICSENLNLDIAVGYEKTKESFSTPSNRPPKNNIDTIPVKGSAAGGAYSTVDDLFKFSRALLENKLLSSEMTDIIITPKVKIENINGQILSYGYGFQIVNFYNKYTRIGHGGAFAGVNTRLDIYKKPEYIVVVLSNYDRPTAFRIAAGVERMITNS